jgi:hypothetical protein
MQACGSDRVREAADGRVILFSRYPKNGWQPRVEKTLTRSEHPGTAIFQDEAIYEIVSADAQPQGGVRYVLEPWRDEHAIRVTDRYDEESEAHRVADHQARIRREQKRKGATIISFLAGHLPAPVQEEMASELGMFAHRMTMMSVISVFVVIVALFYSMAHQVIAGAPVRPWQIIVTAYLMMETAVRFHMAWTQLRPMGSLAGVLVYSMAYAAGWRRGMVSPLQESKGHALYIREEDEDTRLRDAFHVREPLVTLLPAAEQARFAERFDYDYRRHSSPIAWILLIFALAGVYTSLRSGSIFSLLCAGAIAVEQLMRLAAFGRGPAGSVLGVLARPLLKRL